MKNNKPSVLVTFDSMKNANTGLYYFGYGLGNALLKQNRGRFAFSFYLKLKNRAVFKGLVNLVYLFKLHKLVFPQYKSFNVIHFTDQFCRLKPQLVKGKKILTIHDLNPIIELKDNTRLLNLYVEKMSGFINACHKVVAISQFVADDIVHYFPAAKGKISVIYNGADKLTVSPGHIPAYLPKTRFLFTIGNLSPKKNFHVLPCLLYDNDFELVISGTESPAYRDKIMDEARKFNCADRVMITGPISDDDKAWYYQNCEAFLFPSLAEGFGLPVIEAMHFGKPVFLSTHTSLPEIGADKAWYFNNFDAEAMQRMFKVGLKDFYTHNLAEGIKQRAALFTWEKTAEQYLDLYQQCLTNRL